MTTETKATPPIAPGTPLPWEYRHSWRIVGANGQRIDIVVPHSDGADARYIVAACNALPALVEALEKAAAVLRWYEVHGLNQGGASLTAQECEAVLSLLRGGAS